jgi:hypothetical protein
VRSLSKSGLQLPRCRTLLATLGVAAAGAFVLGPAVGQPPRPQPASGAPGVSLARTPSHRAPVVPEARGRRLARMGRILGAPSRLSCARRVGRQQTPACLLDFAGRAAAVFSDPRPSSRFYWRTTAGRVGQLDQRLARHPVFLILLKGRFRSGFAFPATPSSPVMFFVTTRTDARVETIGTAPSFDLASLGAPHRF